MQVWIIGTYYKFLYNIVFTDGMIKLAKEYDNKDYIKKLKY